MKVCTLTFAATVVLLFSSACTSQATIRIVVTPTPGGTPTLTAEEAAYVESLATVAAEQTRAVRLTSTPRATKPPRPTQTPRPTPRPHYDLKLVSFNCTIEYGYITVEGFVENVTGGTLENVQAVGVFSDAEGIPISSDTALIEYDPLLPGQSSPYKVLGRYNPAMQGCSVEFKEFFGAAFRTDYSVLR